MKSPGEREIARGTTGQQRRLHVDVPSALDLVGTITTYLALTPLIRRRFAVGYRECR